MVADHAQPDVGLRVGAVPDAGDLCGPGDHREDLVDLVHVRHALQQVRGALQPHAGVDVLGRQRTGHVEVVLRADGGELLGLEHQVPDLQEAVLVDDRAAVRAVLGAAVDVDLAAGAARTGDAHVPVVVLQPAALDALVRDADLAPQPEGLVIVEVDGDPDLVGVEAVVAVGLAAGDQLPGEVDGAFLEVVAEGEVAVHLEERAVPGGLADLFDVEGAHALLHAHRTVVGGVLRTGEVRLERHHAGVDEQQGRVVVDQRRRGHDRVAARREVVEEALADVSCFHVLCPYECGGCPPELRGRGFSWTSGVHSSRPRASRSSPSRASIASPMVVMKSPTQSTRPRAALLELFGDTLGRVALVVLAALDHDEGGDADADGEPEQPLAHHLPFLVPALLPVTACRTP